MSVLRNTGIASIVGGGLQILGNLNQGSDPGMPIADQVAAAKDFVPGNPATTAGLAAGAYLLGAGTRRVVKHIQAKKNANFAQGIAEHRR